VRIAPGRRIAPDVRGRARASRRKLADLVVLDRDLLDRGAGTIGEARVVTTLVEGAVVYGSSG
jgi:predicted amidohydrolase YtcJ